LAEPGALRLLTAQGTSPQSSGGVSKTLTLPMGSAASLAHLSPRPAARTPRGGPPPPRTTLWAAGRENGAKRADAILSSRPGFVVWLPPVSLVGWPRLSTASGVLEPQVYITSALRPQAEPPASHMLAGLKRSPMIGVSRKFDCHAYVKEIVMSKVSRRSFIEKAGLAVAASPLAQASRVEGSTHSRDAGHAGNGPVRYGAARCVAEWSYTSGRAYADPFNDVELDVVFTDPRGYEQRVPAFWAGEQTWRVRYSPPSAGRYKYRTISSDAANADLHGQTGVLEVSAYAGNNPLRLHGPLRVAADHRHFEHQDGTPFFWLGDTWWMGLCKRLRWPEDFQELAADRVAKGFTVVQIVAGLYPDMPPFDSRGANEAGFPWEADYARINPGYFDAADLRIQHLIEQGLTPCIVGCWGYFLPLMGVARVKKHWRNIIARWGAYPVVWCLAGEGVMPFYLSKTRAEDAAAQRQGWSEVARYVRGMDTYHHPITIHPTDNSRSQVGDPAVLDFDMLQTGHSDRKAYPNTVDQVVASLLKTPRMPVLVGEVCYEGVMEANRQEVERFTFWTSILNGAGGHTYGANGVWQVNTAERPFGPSPHGRNWGNTPWDAAAALPGSRQLGLGKELLMRYAWWRFEPHPEWVDPHWSKEHYEEPYAAGIPREVRVIFIPLSWDPPRVKNLEPGVMYRAFYFNPATGKQQENIDVVPDAEGTWLPPVTPTFEDWILVLSVPLAKPGL
jgi:hypothetical protein